MTSDPVAPVGDDTDDLPPEDRARSAAMVVLLTPLLAAVVALGDWWRLTPWTSAAVCALVLLAGAWRMCLEHVAFVAVVGWCLVTGFSQNGDATLTTTGADIGRLALLVGPAVLLSGWALRSRRRAGHSTSTLDQPHRRSWAR